MKNAPITELDLQMLWGIEFYSGVKDAAMQRFGTEIDIQHILVMAVTVLCRQQVLP